MMFDKVRVVAIPPWWATQWVSWYRACCGGAEVSGEGREAAADAAVDVDEQLGLLAWRGTMRPRTSTYVLTSGWLLVN